MKCFQFNAAAVVIVFCANHPGKVGAQHFPPDAVVEGRSIAEWTQDHWNWDIWLSTAAANDPTIEPFDTPPGQLDRIDNDRPVYFVPGVPIGPGGVDTTIDLVVPPDRPMLAPVIRLHYILAPEEVDADDVPVFISGNPVDGVRVPDADFLRGWAAELNDGIENLFFEFVDGPRLEGAALEEHRIQTTSPVTIPPDSPFPEPEGVWESINDGYWIMFEPLAAGEQLSYRLGAEIPPGPVSITANITAVPEPSCAVLGAIAVACAVSWGRLSCLQKRRWQTGMSAPLPGCDADGLAAF